MGPPVGTTGLPRIVQMSDRIDWDSDLDTEGVASADANYLSGIDGCERIEGQVLEPFDDWNNVNLSPPTSVTRPGGEEKVPWVTDELTYETVLALGELRFDCNGNGVPDDMEIAQGQALDLNGNGIPDECEPTAPASAPNHGGREQVASVELGVTPNPSRGGTTLVLRLEAEGRVRIGLFDVAGRNIAQIFEGSLNAGEHRIALKNRPPGIYFVRLDWEGGTAAGQSSLFSEPGLTDALRTESGLGLSGARSAPQSFP